MGLRLSGVARVTGLAVGLLCAATAAATAQQRQFQSGGLKVEVNRATPPGKGEFGISLVVTNTQDAPLELFTTRQTQALADTGTTYQDPKIGGLPVCNGIGADACNDGIQRGRMTPLTIDAGQSVTVTLAFTPRFRRTATTDTPCSLDLSMPVYLRALSGRTPGAWRLVTVGVPNIKVC